MSDETMGEPDDSQVSADLAEAIKRRTAALDRARRAEAELATLRQQYEAKAELAAKWIEHETTQRLARAHERANAVNPEHRAVFDELLKSHATNVGAELVALDDEGMRALFREVLAKHPSLKAQPVKGHVPAPGASTRTSDPRDGRPPLPKLFGGGQ